MHDDTWTGYIVFCRGMPTRPDIFYTESDMPWPVLLGDVDCAMVFSSKKKCEHLIDSTIAFKQLESDPLIQEHWPNREEFEIRRVGPLWNVSWSPTDTGTPCSEDDE